MTRPSTSSAAARANTSALEAVAEVARELGAFQQDPARAAFFLRGVKTLATVTRSLSAKQVERVVREDDLLTALRASETASKPEDPLAAARLRAVRMQRELIELEGGPLGVAAVADLLGISRQAVSQRRAQRRLLAVQCGTRVWRYPGWQFEGAGVLPGLEQALASLDAASAWDALRFFLTKSPALRGRRPLDELRRGGVERVVTAAQAFDQQGGL